MFWPGWPSCGPGLSSHCLAEHAPGTLPQTSHGSYELGSWAPGVGQAGVFDCLCRPVCLGVGQAGASGHPHRLVCPGRRIPVGEVSRAGEGGTGRDGAICYRERGERNGAGGPCPGGGGVSTRGLDIAKG